jgi:hypothetical protein
MRKIFQTSYIFLAAALVLSGCRKETDWTAQPTSVPNAAAFIKFNFATSYAANPDVQLELNKERVSGLIKSRTPFPGGGYNTNGSNFPDYIAVNPGSVLLGAGIPFKGSATDSIVLLSQSVTLSANKYYTAHITDTATKIKVALYEDDMTPADPGFSKFRFVNLMPDVPAIDLYYGSTLVASNISYLGASPYFTVDIPNSTTPAQAWNTRATGTGPSGTILATYTSANTAINRRVYTAFAMGYRLATDAVRKPYISFLLNK